MKIRSHRSMERRYGDWVRKFKVIMRRYGRRGTEPPAHPDPRLELLVDRAYGMSTRAEGDM